MLNDSDGAVCDVVCVPYFAPANQCNVSTEVQFHSKYQRDTTYTYSKRNTDKKRRSIIYIDASSDSDSDSDIIIFIYFYLFFRFCYFILPFYFVVWFFQYRTLCAGTTSYCSFIFIFCVVLPSTATVYVFNPISLVVFWRCTDIYLQVFQVLFMQTNRVRNRDRDRDERESVEKDKIAKTEAKPQCQCQCRCMSVH